MKYVEIIDDDTSIALSLRSYIKDIEIKPGINLEILKNKYGISNITEFVQSEEMKPEYYYIEIENLELKSFILKHNNNAFIIVHKIDENFVVSRIVDNLNNSRNIITKGDNEEQDYYYNLFVDLDYPLVANYDLYASIQEDHRYITFNIDCFTAEEIIPFKLIILKLLGKKPISNGAQVTSVTYDITDMFNPAIVQLDYIEKNEEYYLRIDEAEEYISFENTVHKMQIERSAYNLILTNGYDDFLNDFSENDYTNLYKSYIAIPNPTASKIASKVNSSLKHATQFSGNSIFTAYGDKIALVKIKIETNEIEYLSDLNNMKYTTISKDKFNECIIYLKSIESVLWRRYQDSKVVKTNDIFVKKTYAQTKGIDNVGHGISHNKNKSKNQNNQANIQTTIENNIPEAPIEQVNSETVEEKKLNITSKDRKIAEEIFKLLENYKNNEDKNNLEKIFDLEEELTDDGETLVRNELRAAIELWDEINGEFFGADYRRVYIKKNMVDELRKLNSDYLNALNDIVVKMKKLPSGELLRFLRLDKRMNEVPADSCNHKVRIIKNRPARFCFWRGKDFSDRLETSEDIYIYSIFTDHDLGISKMNDLKPSKYTENDFVLYMFEAKRFITDRSKYFPELTTKQYCLARTGEGPRVVYGSAGSGKTLVSIDQYWNFAVKNPNYDQSSIAYITFQPKLRKSTQDLIRAYQVKDYCYTMSEYFKYILNIPDSDYHPANEQIFYAWFNENYVKDLDKYNHIADVASIKDFPSIDRIIYTFYRGIYKGSESLSQFDGEPKYTMSKDDFIDYLFETEHCLTRDQIEAIYIVCNKYYAYVKNKNLTDDNDLSLRILKLAKRNEIKHVDTIIIDEVQDLTSLQLHAILKTLSEKSNNVFFYGDPHQMINPTRFDDSVLNKTIYNAFGGEVKLNSSNDLDVIYRTNENLKKYLLYLQETRSELLGKYMDDIAQVRVDLEHSLELTEDAKALETDTWAGYIMDSELEEEALKRVIDSAGCVIVHDDKSKAVLKQKHHWLPEEQIYSIYEAKGLEWKNAILYNMLSDAKSNFDDMIKGNERKSTICRMDYNKYYVACTRANETFIVIENDISKEIEDKMLHSLPRLVDKKGIDLYFSDETTFDDWINYAMRCLTGDDISRAEYLIRKAQRLASSGEERFKAKICYDRYLAKSGKNKDETMRQANEYYRNAEYEEAAFLYRAIKQYQHFNLCRVMQDKNIEKSEHLQNFINSEVLMKHAEAYPHLANQKFFYVFMQDLYNKVEKTIRSQKTVYESHVPADFYSYLTEPVKAFKLLEKTAKRYKKEIKQNAE